MPTIESLLSDGGDFSAGDLDNESLFSLFQAARDRKLDVVKGDGVLTVTASKSAVRAINRAHRAERTQLLGELVVESLESARPQKIGTIVDFVVKSGKVPGDAKTLRGEVLQACRNLRDSKKLTSHNSTTSNFHMSWTLADKPDKYPADAHVAVEPVPVVDDTVVDDDDIALEIS